MTWSYYTLNLDGEPTSQLDDTVDKEVSWKLTGAGTASFTITADLSSTQGSPVDPVRSDLLVTWDDMPMWRGRLGGYSRAFDAQSVVWKQGAVDYRGWLSARVAHRAVVFGVNPDPETDPLVYPEQNTAHAAWQLIDYTQKTVDLPGGDWGLTLGAVDLVVSTGGSSDEPFQMGAGSSIAAAIDDLAAMAPGFEWWVDGGMAAHFVRKRGTAREFALVFGDTVVAVDETFDPGTYGNLVHLTGATTSKTGVAPLTPEIRWVDDLGSRPEGRIERQQSDTSIEEQHVVAARADTAIKKLSVMRPSWQVTLAPGAWTPDDFWVGDEVPLTVQAGPTRVVAEMVRVNDITVRDNGDGIPAVSVTVGEPLPHRNAEFTDPALTRALNRLGRGIVDGGV